MTPTEIAIELELSGLCVCLDYLSPSVLSATRLDFTRSHEAGDFHRAGVGQAAAKTVRDLIRRDEILWLDQTQTSNESQVALWQQFGALQTAINRKLFLGLNDFEAHYAAYSAGGFYSRHLDAFAKQNTRLVSFIVYLNEDWKEADGGRLKIYGNRTPREIDPVGGTLVCFMSEETEHEVLPSFSGRKSIAGWFRSV